MSTGRALWRRGVSETGESELMLGCRRLGVCAEGGWVD